MFGCILTLHLPCVLSDEHHNNSPDVKTYLLDRCYNIVGASLQRISVEPDYQGVLIFHVTLHNNVSFGTTARCLDYAGVHIFKCSD